MNLYSLIATATQSMASDIHINKAIYFRINKKILLFAPRENIESKEIESIKAELDSIIQGKNEKSITLKINESKIRITSFLSNSEMNYAIRILKSNTPLLSELNTPKVLESLSLESSGLILVCGATGVGKSTTIAAMINHINTNANKHILTIEDPIEYEHISKNSVVTQREISLDSNNFKDALKASLRQDPDVILIGEILDSDVLKMAINHALSGHLVFASFHAFSCSNAVARILGMCAGEANANANLADCLQGIITQKLYVDNALGSVSSNTGHISGNISGSFISNASSNLSGDISNNALNNISGNLSVNSSANAFTSTSSGTKPRLKADFEILVATPAVRILIKENKINQLDSQISMGKEFGMQHFSKKSP